MAQYLTVRTLQQQVPIAGAVGSVRPSSTRPKSLVYAAGLLHAIPPLLCFPLEWPALMSMISRPLPASLEPRPSRHARKGPPSPEISIIKPWSADQRHWGCSRASPSSLSPGTLLDLLQALGRSCARCLSISSRLQGPNPHRQL